MRNGVRAASLTGLLSLTAMLLLRHLVPRVPAALAVAITATILVGLFGGEAAGVMNPRITGVGMKAATQPMRSAPKSRKNAPINTANVEVSVLKSAVAGAATAPTVSAEIRPVAVSGPTTSRREVPNSA